MTKKIDEVRNQVRGLDKALRLIYDEKASKGDLETLKRNLQEASGVHLFEQMKSLFDTCLLEVKTFIDKEKAGLREGFQYVLREQSLKCEVRDFNTLNSRVDYLENTINSLSNESLSLKDQLTHMTYKFTMSKLEEDLRNQAL